MIKQIGQLCKEKELELLNKYFGDLVPEPVRKKYFSS